jgi:hypothetical protein
MLNERPPLPLRFRLQNKKAKFLNANNKPVACLDEETLCREAIEETGLTDFGNPYHREGFFKLLESAEQDANLHYIGRTCVHGMIVTFLTNRLLLAEARKQNPNMFRQSLIPPIIVLGLPRTGTTFLHRMLAADPTHRAVPMWEMLRPLPNGSDDRRREFAEQWIKFKQKLNPHHDRIHYARADIPAECITLQGTTFSSMVFLAFAPVHSYAEWYASHDHFEAYQEYYSLLQILQTVDPKRRLTLKAPAHTGSLPNLHQVIPEALIIQTHRDPVAVCNSANSRSYSAHGMLAERLDVPRMTEGTLHLLEDWTATSLAFRETHPGVIYDVMYDQLVADPVGTVKGIYDHFDLVWSDAFQERLQAYVRDNPQGKYGKHRYSSADFGLTDEAITRRFTEYSREFGFNY